MTIKSSLEQSTDANLILDRVFKESRGRNAILLQISKELYQLPTITNDFEVSRDFFAYARDKHYFISLVLYDENKRILLAPSANTWALPTGSIHQDESWHEAVNRIAANVIPGAKLGEVEPVAEICNRFTYGRLAHTHTGIAFTARVRNASKLDKDEIQGNFVYPTTDELDFIKAYSNRQVVDRALPSIEGKRTELQEDEISTNEQYRGRYSFHNAVIKRFILTDGLKRRGEFIGLVRGLMADAKTVVDVSCGDSNLLGQIGRELPDLAYAVANDISWSQISMIRDKSDRIVYTNHDAVNLPFRDKSFDVALCCNTLHHMPSRPHLEGLLDGLRRVADKAVIIEIEKPSATGGFPALLNKYWYQTFLRDVGGAYLEHTEFKAIVEHAYQSSGRVEFDSFRNALGHYMIASVNFREDENERTPRD